jgi:hypothetical protein
MDLYIHSPIRLHGVVLNYLSTGTTLPFYTRYDVSMIIEWMNFFSFLGWGETESTWYVGHYTAYCISPGREMRSGQVGEMRIGRRNLSTRKKTAPVTLCPPQIPHDLT